MNLHAVVQGRWPEAPPDDHFTEGGTPCPFYQRNLPAITWGVVAVIEVVVLMVLIL